MLNNSAILDEVMLAINSYLSVNSKEAYLAWTVIPVRDASSRAVRRLREMAKGCVLEHIESIPHLNIIHNDYYDPLFSLKNMQGVLEEID